jgi:predicted NBD/HSP70 family sugar kinase
VISDGKLFRGHHETAGEIRGWNVLGATSGKRAWLEDEATVRSIGKKSKNAPGEWEAFIDGCLAGDAKSLGALDRFVSLHADTVTRLVQLSDPELVVVAGAFNELGDLYLEELQSKCRRFLTDHYFPPPETRYVKRAEFAGAHGAAALAAQNFVPGEE